MHEERVTGLNGGLQTACRTTRLALAVRLLGPPAKKRLSQRRIYDRQGVIAFDVVDRGDAQYVAQLVRWHFKRSRTGRLSGRRLGKRRGGRGMEGDVTFHLLHRLVDMAVEHRHRTEPPQIGEGLRAITGAPSPIRVDHPQRDVSEDDNGCAAAMTFQVLFEPGQLLLSQIA